MVRTIGGGHVIPSPRRFKGEEDPINKEDQAQGGAFKKLFELGECGEEALKQNPSYGEEDASAFPVFLSVFWIPFCNEFLFYLRHHSTPKKSSIRFRNHYKHFDISQGKKIKYMGMIFYVF